MKGATAAVGPLGHRVIFEVNSMDQTLQPLPVVLPNDQITGGSSGLVEVKRYVKPDGWVSRYWAIYVGGELLAVVLYKKGAVAIADRLSVSF